MFKKQHIKVSLCSQWQTYGEIHGNKESVEEVKNLAVQNIAQIFCAFRFY